MKFYDLKKSLPRTQKPQPETGTEIPKQTNKQTVCTTPIQEDLFSLASSSEQERCVGRNFRAKEATTTRPNVCPALHHWWLRQQ